MSWEADKAFKAFIIHDRQVCGATAAFNDKSYNKA